MFGLIAVFGTEVGINFYGATMNVRDAAPIVSGLLFGGPSGLIAGLIGGIERWFSVLWGRGEFTRLGCSLATVASGVYAALLRRYLFDERKPTWTFGLAIGVVAEVLHLALIFLTNTDNIRQAFLVVEACTGPMLFFNGVSVAASVLVATVLAGEPLRKAPEKRGISDSVQSSMLTATVCAFVATSIFTNYVHVKLSDAETYSLIKVGVADVVSDVRGAERTIDAPEAQERFIENLARSWHVGESGQVFIADTDGTIVSSLNDSAVGTLHSLGFKAPMATVGEDEVFVVNYRGTECYALYETTPDYLVLGIVPKEEADFSRKSSLLIGAYVEIMVFATLFTVIYFILKRVVVDNIYKITGTLAKITGGKLDEVVDVRSNREFASLSDDINSTVGALKRAIDEAAARIDAELEYARVIQRSALPRFFPPYPWRHDFEVFATMDAAKEVGGDFYDFYLVDDNHLAFLVADVSGKGIPGAMFMMTAKTLLKSLMEAGVPVADAMTHGNDELCASNDAEMFVTVWMGLLDCETGHVTYANAGHNPPLVSRGGTFEYVSVRPNLVLAGMEGIRYQTHELDLAPGDAIFLYTDGVTEATNASDELFGEDRLIDTLNKHATDDVEALCRVVHTEVDTFVGTAPQFDDITMLALRFWGGK